MNKFKKLLGIDLFRGLAVFAVIILHTDEGVDILPTAWSWVVKFSFFAVPFFLATAFYLSTRKLYYFNNKYKFSSRLYRLLIPYICWSIFYLVYKTAKYFAAGESDRIINLFSDPVGLFFFGGAAFHLYFLPLLATGTFTLKLIEYFIRNKTSTKTIVWLSLASLILYQVVLSSNNAFINGENIAFKYWLKYILPSESLSPIIRVFFVAIAFMIRCLPYATVAALINHPDNQKFSNKLIEQSFAIWLIAFITCNAFGQFLLPSALEELFRGYTALLAAIAVSRVLQESYLLASLGKCSFGIYFIHLFFVETFQSIAVRFFPNYGAQINTLTLLIVSILIFTISWIVTNLLMRSKKLSQLLYSY
ncbi:acyltransferase [Myxosarcina sp. GI1]|uniref:acyltransferase family protein n=1 Tax=Myxosarcina sp. GI1 TaxID=1541065 RepID=UPI00055CC64D|nr:acyltransferase [Myxosarcina sp. GI1]